MQEGLAHDFAVDDTHTYVAVLGSDADTLDLMGHYHHDNFVLSMGAYSVTIGSEIFERYLKGDITLDDIPPAPFNNDNAPAAIAATPSKDIPKPDKPKTQHAPAPLPVKPSRPAPIPRRNDLRTTDGRLRYFQDIKRRRRIAEANKAKPT